MTSPITRAISALRAIGGEPVWQPLTQREGGALKAMLADERTSCPQAAHDLACAAIRRGLRKWKYEYIHREPTPDADEVLPQHEVVIRMVTQAGYVNHKGTGGTELEALCAAMEGMGR